MKENLHGRYTDTVLDLLNKAAYLDPRFKSLTFLTDSEKLRIEDHIIAEATDCCIPQMENITSSRSTFHGERKLLHTLEDVFSHEPAAKIPQMFLTMTRRLGGKLHCMAQMFTILKVTNGIILILYNGGQVQ